MKRFFILLLPAFLFCVQSDLQSQETLKTLDNVYGLDQTLYNGKKYTYTILYSTNGHQYLLTPRFSYGSVTVKGKHYEHIALNYDIYNQKLIVKYFDKTGALTNFEVSHAWLQGFTLENMNFELLHLEQEPAFYQVLGIGPLKILYHWRKSLDLETVVGSANYVFNSPVRESFVLMDGQLNRFKTKRSLIRLFTPDLRSQIKSYMRKNKIKVRRSSDPAMADMINYIGTIR